MHRVLSFGVIVVLAGALAGCAIKGDAATAKSTPPTPAPAVHKPPPPPPPAPLSTPQTQVQLPPPQPVLAEALATAEEPVVTELPEPPASNRPPRRTPAASTSPRNDPPTPAANTPVVQPQGPAPAPERPRLVEAISPEEQKRLTDSVAARRREVAQNLDQAASRGPNATEKTLMNRIRSFQRLADDAIGAADFRQADQLMERAQILSRELQNAH